MAVLSWDIRVTCPYQRSCDLSSRRSSNSMFRDFNYDIKKLIMMQKLEVRTADLKSTRMGHVEGGRGGCYTRSGLPVLRMRTYLFSERISCFSYFLSILPDNCSHKRGYDVTLRLDIVQHSFFDDVIMNADIDERNWFYDVIIQSDIEHGTRCYDQIMMTDIAGSSDLDGGNNFFGIRYSDLEILCIPRSLCRHTLNIFVLSCLP